MRPLNEQYTLQTAGASARTAKTGAWPQAAGSRVPLAECLSRRLRVRFCDAMASISGDLMI